MKNRSKTRLLLGALLTAAASAGVAESPTDCSALQKDAARLACYDAIFRPAPVAAPAPASNSKFGEEQVKRRIPKASTHAPTKSASLTAIVTRLDRGARKELLFYLNNGQLWKQQGERYLQIKAGDSVTIRRGKIGGYTLVTAKGRSSKVTRLK